MVNEHFVKLLEEMKAIHEKKNHDYSSIGFYQNFERSSELMSWFRNNMDKAFANLVGTKLARLATLLDNTEAPLNESIDDSFLDLCTYCGLWASWHKASKNEMSARDYPHTFVPYEDKPSFCGICNLHITSHKIKEVNLQPDAS